MKTSRKNAIKTRDKGRCVQCGSTEELTIDHIIPKSLGGGNSQGNLQLLCRKCNESKADRLDENARYKGKEIIGMQRKIKSLTAENLYLKNRILELAGRLHALERQTKREAA